MISVRTQRSSIAVLLCVLLALSACATQSPDTELHAAPRPTEDRHDTSSSVVRGPQKAQDCAVDDPRSSASAPLEELPPSVNVECTWQMDGNIIGQSGSIAVVDRQHRRNGKMTHQLAGYDVRNGALVWEGEIVTFHEEIENTYEIASDAGVHLLRNGENSYAVLFTRTRNTRTNTTQTTLRFYPVHSTGQLRGAVYRAEEGFAPHTSPAAARTLSVPIAARVLLVKQAEQPEYLVVNPETATAEPLTLNSDDPETRGVWALATGNVIAHYKVSDNSTQYISGTTNAYAVYGEDGAVQWRTPDVAPEGAAPQEAHIAGSIAGSYGEQIIVWWRKGTYTGDHSAWLTRPAIVALHDAQTGAVIASQEIPYTGASGTPPPPISSPDGRFVACESVVFDRAESSVHASLQRNIALAHITNTGVGYGRDVATGSDEAVAVTLSSGEITWRSQRYDVLPVASSEGTLIFQAAKHRYSVAFPLK